MKRIIFLFMASFLLCAYSFAQVTTLTFTAKDTNGFYICLDHVVINNLTKDWTETIYYPDTVLIMGASGIEDAEHSSHFSLFRNVPNPFAGISEFSLLLTESQKVTISVFDTEGKKITATEKSLLPGEHAFRLLLSSPQTYLLNVRAGTEQASLTVINTGNAGTNRIEYLQSSRSPLKISPLKTNKGQTDNPFDLGDEMEYIGYAIINDTEFESEHIQQLQLTSESFELLFAVYTAPTVVTTEILDITPTSATSGGEVTFDGNLPVTARGVCWSTSPEPTITDYLTSDSTGLGIFISSLTGLTANTTYYVRAYATNDIGTGYGPILSFTTLSPSCSDGVTDIDGNHYNGVEIGNQCWMKENLRVTKYFDGSLIDLGTDMSLSTAYLYYPDADVNNVSEYGYLYNWIAIMGNSPSSSTNPSGVQGACPTGWHIPSNAEWLELINYLGGESVAGGKLKEVGTNHWESPNTGATNQTGFSLLPSGFYFGDYYGIGEYTILWSSTEDDDNDEFAWVQFFFYDTAEVVSITDTKQYGYSVRCVRD